MLPSNVMSFMKKMVAADEAPTQSTPESTGTFGKLKQTLSSSLLTAQDKVHKMSPRPSLVPDQAHEAHEFGSMTMSVGQSATSGQHHLHGGQQQHQQQQQQQQSIGGAKIEPGKPPSRAGACRVCLKSFKPDDYSKTCYECQQRVCEDCASYSKLDEHEDANTWRCSVCRRKMASRICIPQDSTDSMLDVPVLEALQRRHSDVKLGSTLTLGPPNGAGLAPPRSPELRRHSDVSPASLKELEKLKGTKTPSGESEWRGGGGRSGAPSRSSSPPRRGDFDVPPSRIASRRQSRVGRQHSYDDEIKAGGVGGGGGGGGGIGGAGETIPVDIGLGIPSPMPRRASAYDVFAPGVLAAAVQQASARQPEPDRPISRRPSFRALPPDETPQKDTSPSPDKSSPVLTVEVDDRRMRRRGSQLPDIAALRDRGALPVQLTPPSYAAPALEDLEAPRRQASMDGESIKIVIHDVDSGPICASKRRVILRRDPTDKAHRTRGFGMRVVGGKTGADGRLFAYIVWTVPGGPAEKGGLQQGDKILEWNSVSLIDRSFEEVCAIMDRTGDVVDLLVEHATDFRMCDLLEDGGPPGGGQSGPRKSGDGSVALGLVPDTESTDKSPSSPTRRKLPKTPEQIAREKQVSGRVQLQVWYHSERTELVVSLMAADDLAPRDDSIGHGNLPEAYAKTRILPKTGSGNVAQTEVSPPTVNPIWNATLTFPEITAADLMDKTIEIELWDLVPQSDATFLGECSVDLQKAFLDDQAVWYRLEDPRGIRANAGRTPNVSPRCSLAGDAAARPRMHRNDYGFQRSQSDDVDSIGDGLTLLHPDHAWIAGSRRGSSQSETLEVEVYQLGKDFSHSVPSSRRSSFQDRDEYKNGNGGGGGGGGGDATPPTASYLRDRRRSSCTRRDPDETLRSLKAVKGELGRTMSLTGTVEKRASSSRRSSRVRKDSCIDIPELQQVAVVSNIALGHATKAAPNDLDAKIWRGSNSTIHSPVLSTKDSHVVLGPGQIQPKGYRLSAGRYGELKLGLVIAKGVMEVDVVCARNIVPVNCETPPDTYVKCYLKDCERLRQKKKTRVVRHSAEPFYRQTLKYQATDVFGRALVVMVWQRCVGFEHNQGLGGAELCLDKMKLSNATGGWYPLFPIHSFGSDSNDSP